MPAVAVIHSTAPCGAFPTLQPKVNEEAHLALVDTHVALAEPWRTLNVPNDSASPPRGRHRKLSQKGLTRHGRIAGTRQSRHCAVTGGNGSRQRRLGLRRDRWWFSGGRSSSLPVKGAPKGKNLSLIAGLNSAGPSALACQRARSVRLPRQVKPTKGPAQDHIGRGERGRSARTPSINAPVFFDGAVPNSSFNRTTSRSCCRMAAALCPDA
jgi:hypothetical protein